MKKLLLFILIPFFLLSCKDKDELNSSSIYGKWKLTSSCGGIAGCNTASDKNITTLEITKKEIIAQTINTQTNTSDYYNRVKYTTLKLEVQDMKVVYNLELEDGRLYNIEVSEELLVLQHSFLESYYKKQ